MRTLIIFIIYLCLVGFVNAQTIEQQSLSSLGISQNNTDLTVGETTIFGNQHLTQGFHQGKLTITSLTGPNSTPEITVFPNPTLKYLYIDAQRSEPFDIRIFDSMGKHHLMLSSVTGFERIDIQSLPAGNYVLFLSDKKGLINTHLIQKTN